MTLDSTGVLFQNLNGAADDLTLELNKESNTYFVSFFHMCEYSPIPWYSLPFIC